MDWRRLRCSGAPFWREAGSSDWQGWCAPSSESDVSLYSIDWFAEYRHCFCCWCQLLDSSSSQCSAIISDERPGRGRLSEEYYFDAVSANCSYWGDRHWSASTWCEHSDAGSCQMMISYSLSGPLMRSHDRFPYCRFRWPSSAYWTTSTRSLWPYGQPRSRHRSAVVCSSTARAPDSPCKVIASACVPLMAEANYWYCWARCQIWR